MNYLISNYSVKKKKIYEKEKNWKYCTTFVNTLSRSAKCIYLDLAISERLYDRAAPAPLG